MFGLGGVASDLLADRAFRVLPVSDDEVAAMLRSLRASPLLFGYRGARPVDSDGLQDVLVRLAHLARDVPELAEVDLNPLVARPDDVEVLDAKVRLAAPADPYPLLRRLRP